MLKLECPNCHVSLVQSHELGGIFYTCPSCGGRSAGLMLLRKLGLPFELYEELNIVSHKGAEPFARKCPHCSRKMRKSSVVLNGMTVELDVCEVCKQVWFDPSEFQMLQLKAPEKETEAPLPPEARRIIAEYNLQKIEEKNKESYFGDDATPSDPLKMLAGLLGMPVELDEEAKESKPYMTYLLTGIFLLTALGINVFSSESYAIKTYGFIVSQWGRDYGLTILSSFFIHAGIFHLLGNLYFFYVFANNVEERLGKINFLLLLFGAHISGLICYVLFGQSPDIPSVGASGGIAGILAYYAIMFPNAKIAFCFRWFFWISCPASVLVVIFICIQLGGAYFQMGSSGGGVNYLAHLGGLSVGAFAAAVSIWRELHPGKK